MANKDSKGNQEKKNRDSASSGGSGKGGAATQRAGDESTASGAYKDETGDPGRTPGSAEGVENFDKTGNE